jgi:hypothetical protein
MIIIPKIQQPQMIQKSHIFHKWVKRENQLVETNKILVAKFLSQILQKSIERKIKNSKLN